ncbi:MAG: hypothetical protein IPK60_17650 [Sandaracinaceae bacterium]|nr:hypothetical protein [Sandaracinaceae bacterium]
MTKRFLTWMTATALMATVAAGCVVEVTFTPLGSDFSVDGSWQINGATPTTSSCADAGISEVQMLFFDGSTQFVFDTFACTDGSFDTRPTKVLAFGSYTTQWRALNAAGGIVATGEMTPLVVTNQTHVTLAAVNFVVTPTFNPLGSDFSVDGMWQINGTAPTTPLCASAGIATVRMVFYDAAMTMHSFEGFTFACADGGFDSRPTPVLAYGSYTTRWQALDGTGTVIAQGDMTPLVVTNQTHVTLQPVNFLVTIPTTTRLTINLTYDIDPSSTMSDADCATAGVATIGYALRNAATTIIPPDTRSSHVACTSQLVYEEPTIVAGTYSILVDGYDALGEKMWTVTCTDLTVDDNEQATYNCALDLQASGG